VIADWARADGDWPEDYDPRDPVTALGSMESI
jgi:hypothetical protein